jgi:nucleoside phosphorylase
MKILVLEDDSVKREIVLAEIYSLLPSADIAVCVNFHEFTIKIVKDRFDLVIVDLLVPRHRDSLEPEDLSELLVDVLRDVDCPNFNAPALALTGFDAAAEENIQNLNKKDIQVVTFSRDKDDWKDVLKAKVMACIPSITYDFAIICALKKEVKGFEEAGYVLAPPKGHLGLECRELKIGQKTGVVILSARMGLVSCAITTAHAIDAFSPKIVCMSGICAGIKGKSKIYDVVIPDICHQHDYGKWGADGFEPENYSVQLSREVNLKISEIIDGADFKNTVKAGVHLGRSEYPDDMETLEFDVYTAPTSSGSAVIADEKMVAKIKEQHRKLAAFEMESYAMYEAARLSHSQPKYFSAKAVVDDGSVDKGDSFHRVACLLSAKVVYELISRGI